MALGTSSSQAPYPGLRSFQRHEVDIFFGRDDHIDEMIAKLAASHFLCITGPSGCGKSSLARTGLMNALEAGFLPGTGSDWVFVDMRPGDEPLATLVDTMAKAVVGDPAADEAQGAQQQKRIGEIKQLLANRIENRQYDLNQALRLIESVAGRPVLILVDQFEELFRYAQKDPHAAITFVEVLLQTMAAHGNNYVTITIRTDELEKCSRYPGLTAAINASQFLTPALDRFQIQEAIEGPIAVFGGKIDPSFTIWLLNSVEDELDKLPLLQHTLKLLYDKKRAGAAGAAEHPPVTIGYDDFLDCFFHDRQPPADVQGGALLRLALSGRLDSIHHALPEPLQRGAARAFCALTLETGRRDIRQPLKLDQLAHIINLPQLGTQEIVKAFAAGDTYLTVKASPSDPDNPMIDVTHECVLRLWDTLRSEWLPAERRSADNIRYLAQSAKNFAERRSWLATVTGENALSGETLNRYQQWFTEWQPTAAWAARYLGDFSWSEHGEQAGAVTFDTIARFLKASRRKESLRRGLTTAIGIAAVVVVAVWGVVRINATIDQQRQRANNLQQETRKLEKQRGDTTDAVVGAVLGAVAKIGEGRGAPAADAARKPEAELALLSAMAGMGIPRCETVPGFCDELDRWRKSLPSAEDLAKTAATPLCPTESAYKTIAAVSSFSMGDCSSQAPEMKLAASTPGESAQSLLTPVTQNTKVAPEVSAQYSVAFDIAQRIVLSPGGQPVAHSLLATVAKQNETTPIVFRNFGASYIGDSTIVTVQERFASAGTCFKRAIDLSCQNKQDYHDLYSSAYALAALFEKFDLRPQQLTVLLSLSRDLLGEEMPTPEYAAQHHNEGEISRLSRGAAPTIEAAQIIGEMYGCSAANPPPAGGDAAKACDLAKSLYDRAAHAFADVFAMGEMTNLNEVEKVELTLGALTAGLAWGQDSAFRGAAKDVIDPKLLGGWLQQGVNLRDQKRFYAASAMFNCLEKNYPAAKKAAQNIPDITPDIDATPDTERLVSSYRSADVGGDVQVAKIKKLALACNAGDPDTLFDMRPMVK